MSAHTDHLLRVAERAIERGDSKPAETLLSMYRTEAHLLQKFPGSRASVVTRNRKRLDKVRWACRKLGDMIATAPENTNHPGSSPWAEAQKARRRRDPLAYMKLTDRQINAADEIRTIFEATVKSLMPGNAQLDKVQVDTSIIKRDPWLGLSPWVGERRIRVYMPWVQEFGRVVIARRADRCNEVLCVVDLVLRILLDHDSLRSLAVAWGADTKRLSRAFRKALDGYGQVARERRAA